MRFKNLLLIAAMAAPTIPGVASANEEHEKTVKLEDIPAPARDRLLKEAKGAPFLRVEEEQKHGKTVYEGVIKQGKEEVGIVVDAKGAYMGKHSEKNEKGEK